MTLSDIEKKIDDLEHYDDASTEVRALMVIARLLVLLVQQVQDADKSSEAN